MSDYSFKVVHKVTKGVVVVVELFINKILNGYAFIMILRESVTKFSMFLG